MSNNINNQRIDEVENYYKIPSLLDKFLKVLFWGIVLLSLFVLCPSKLFSNWIEFLKNLNILANIIFTVFSFYLTVIAIPKAEKKRRQQLLSNALGAPLIIEKTNLYYNNDYAPSIERLGANIMENAFFSKAVVQNMLITIRFYTIGYLLIWLSFFVYRASNADLLLSITQVVFSSAVLFRYLQLELLRHRHEITFNNLYNHFYSQGGNQAKSTALILDNFADYETSKSIAGSMLNSDTFFKLNDELTKKWNIVCSELKLKE